MKRLFIAIILILCSTDVLAGTSVTIDLINPKLTPVTSPDSRPVYVLLVPRSYYRILERSERIEHPIWLRFRLKIDSDLTDSPRGFYRKTGNDGYEDFTSFVVEKNSMTENQALIVRQGITQPYDIYFKNFVGRATMETHLEFGLPLIKEVVYRNRQDANGELGLTFTMSRHQRNTEIRDKPLSMIIRPANFDITGEITQISADTVGLQVRKDKADIDLKVCCGKQTQSYGPEEELDKVFEFKQLTGENAVGVAVRIMPVFPYDIDPIYIESDTRYLVRKYIKMDTVEAYEDFSPETAKVSKVEPDDSPDVEGKKIPNLTRERRLNVKKTLQKVCIVEGFSQDYGFQVKMRPKTSIAEILGLYNKSFLKNYYQKIQPRDVVEHNLNIGNFTFLKCMIVKKGSGSSVVVVNKIKYDWRKAQYGVVFYLPAYEKSAD